MTGVPPLVHAARKLRREMSLPEVMLWQALRQRPDGLKFRRQHAVGAYVLDFYCASAKLAIEIDGRVHDAPEQVRGDAARDAWLGERGIRCMRIAAPRVLADHVRVAASIVSMAKVGPVAAPLHHRKGDGPPPRAGEDRTDSGLLPCR